MDEVGSSSIIGNLLMIIITIILAVAVLAVGLYYAGVLVHEPFIGKLVPDQENSSPNYLNATFIYSSPPNNQLNVLNMRGYFLYNGSEYSIIFTGSNALNGYYLYANFSKFIIYFNIIDQGGNIINNSNIFISDNSIFTFHSNESVNFNSIEIVFYFEGYPGRCSSFL